MYDISVHRLRVFKCVVEAGGVRAAGSLLGISQPSVSAHIRALEGRFGPLFDRRPGKAGSLTDAGHIVYNYAHDVVVGADDVAALLRELHVGQRGHVSFAATRTLGNSHLGPILTDFHRRHPGVLISVQTGRLPEVTDMVLSGSVGFGLVVAPGPVAGLEGELLRGEPVLLLAAPSHRLAVKREVHPSDLATERLFVSLRASTNFRWMMSALRPTGFSYQCIAIETDDYALLKSIVAEGPGIAVLPRAAVEAELACGKLVSLQTSFRMPEFQLRLIHLRRHRFAPSEEALYQLIQDRLSPETPL